MGKVEYLVVDFDAPPFRDQLNKEFGNERWTLASMLLITLQDEGSEPVSKLRAYFVREVDESRIVVPK